MQHPCQRHFGPKFGSPRWTSTMILTTSLKPYKFQCFGSFWPSRGTPKPSNIEYRARGASKHTFPTGPVKGAKKTSKMLPLGYLLGPLGATMPHLGRLEGGQEICVFFRGVPMLTFAPKLHPFRLVPDQLLDPILAPFSSRYPKIAQCPKKLRKYPKSYQKCSKNSTQRLVLCMR